MFVLVPESNVEAFPDAHSYDNDYGNVGDHLPTIWKTPASIGTSRSSIGSSRPAAPDAVIVRNRNGNHFGTQPCGLLRAALNDLVPIDSRKVWMALAPIRGAPPGAPNPDFPVDKPTQPSLTPAPVDQPPAPPVRQRHAPIVIGSAEVTFTFRVIPEQPAIARASMTIHITTGSYALGFVRMSAAKARALLGDLQNERSPIIAAGDEDGTIKIKLENTDAGLVLQVCKPGERNALGRWVLDQDLKAAANELLADLGL
jgi:hypothetical protein